MTTWWRMLQLALLFLRSTVLHSDIISALWIAACGCVEQPLLFLALVHQPIKRFLHEKPVALRLLKSGIDLLRNCSDLSPCVLYLK